MAITKKQFEKSATDKALDKKNAKKGIKEGSKEDNRIDKMVMARMNKKGSALGPRAYKK